MKQSRIFDMGKHEAALDKIVVRSFSASYMSNSKWRKCFLALASHQPAINSLMWKFVGREDPIRGAAPDLPCLGESYVTRTSFSAFPYKQIEWVEIIGATEMPSAVTAVGQFEYALLPSGVRIYGYR
jgi:hypothetical protein